MSNAEATRDAQLRTGDVDTTQREWDSFEGPRPMPDGRVPRFWIRDLPLTLEEEVLTLMCEVYLREEQMAVATDTADDPQSFADLEGMWRDAIRHKRISLAAFTDWPHGDATRLTLVGVNVLGIVQRNDPPMTMRGRWSRPMYAVLNEMVRSADVFARYDVSSFLFGMGLCVAPAFRGQRVGQHLLQARRPLCAALGVPLTVTAFSGAQSQKQARRAGFEVLETRVYKDIVDQDGSRPYTTTTWPVIELHALFYGPSDQQEKEDPVSEH